ncbi:hypothetical protein GALMADRAFT_159879 [Galerina marginata CBS 339.88]|uniref:Uncharacterized protein n=1 Tax=Galerina marginata (strain CBS 339.88) TaxID=685588 RepID=A0A067SRQ3_GALM3|nr:hypothetical protein GALMADRAFT_159879 [Galerina marginata CBS 339.88]
MIILNITTVPPYLLTRGLDKESPWVGVIFFAAMILVICITIALGNLSRKWMVRTDVRAVERRQQEQEQEQVPEAEDDHLHASDTRPSHTAQPLRGSSGRETRHGRTMPPVRANIRPGITEPFESPIPTPPPAYNTLEPTVQPRSRTAPVDAAPLDLYGVPAARLDSSNSPEELLSVHLREGDQIGDLDTSDQHNEHDSGLQRDRLFYLAARFRQPQRLHGRDHYYEHYRIPKHLHCPPRPHEIYRANLNQIPHSVAVTVMQRARSFATRLLQLEPTPSTVIPPTVSAEIVSREPQPVDLAVNLPPAATVLQASWPTPAPATFTISYTPLSTSYPDPPNSVTRLPTDAVRVTQRELELILHQSYLHGSEHGWKPAATQALQARYDKDMLTVTSKFDELLKQEFTRGLEQATVRLKAKYEQEHLDRLFGLVERAKEISDEDFNRGFNDGRDAGIREESKRRESAQAELTDYGTQTELPLPIQPFSVDFGAQTESSPEPDHPLHVDFGIQTESIDPDSLRLLEQPKFHPITMFSPDPNYFSSSLPILILENSPLPYEYVTTPASIFFDSCSRSSNFKLPSDILLSDPSSCLIPHLELSSIPPILPKPSSSSVSSHPSSSPSSVTELMDPTSFIWSDEPSDIPVLSSSPSIPPLAPEFPTSFPSRDFSDLRSGANPWRSLQHRKGRDRRRPNQPFIQYHRRRQLPFYSLHHHPNIPHTQLPTTSYSKSSSLPLPMPLDWHADPRLFELSQVLKTLGWAPPSTTRP